MYHTYIFRCYLPTFPTQPTLFKQILPIVTVADSRVVVIQTFFASNVVMVFLSDNSKALQGKTICVARWGPQGRQNVQGVCSHRSWRMIGFDSGIVRARAISSWSGKLMTRSIKSWHKQMARMFNLSSYTNYKINGVVL